MVAQTSETDELTSKRAKLRASNRVCVCTQVSEGVPRQSHQTSHGTPINSGRGNGCGLLRRGGRKWSYNSEAELAQSIHMPY